MYVLKICFRLIELLRAPLNVPTRDETAALQQHIRLNQDKYKIEISPSEDAITNPPRDF